MKRQEFIARIANQTSQKPLLVQKILREFIKVLVDVLKSGDKISISGLGLFCTKPTKPKIGRNPKTKEKIVIPARRKVSFRPTDWIRKYINS